MPDETPSPDEFRDEVEDLVDAYADGEIGSIEEFEARVEERFETEPPDAIADGGATIANPEAANQALDAFVSQRHERQVESFDDAELREHVERAGDPETVWIDVGGDLVECEPLGVGQRIRPLKTATRAEERGDDMAAAEAVLSMIDALVEASDAMHDQSYWDGLSEDELRSAYRDLAESSGGGDRAGE